MIEYNDDNSMPWGVHQGKRMGDIPPGYFKYIYNKFKWNVMKPMGAEGLAIRKYLCDKGYHLS